MTKKNVRKPPAIPPDETGGKVNIDEIVLQNGASLQNVFPLILQIVSEVRSRNNTEGMTQEELVAVALQQLSRCNYQYAPNRGLKLTTFAYRAIAGAVQDYIEREWKYRGKNEVLPPEAFEEIQKDKQDDRLPEKLSDKLLFRKIMKMIRTRLSPEIERVLIRSFLDEVPDYALAKEMGCSFHRIVKLKAKGLADLRRMLGHKPSGTSGWVSSTDN